MRTYSQEDYKKRQESNDVPHGTALGYNYYGCRCELCKKAVIEYNQLRYEARKQYALDYLGGKCVQCGTTDNLEFDHSDRTNKVANATSFFLCKLEKLKEELDKCQLLCYDCHMVKSNEERRILQTKPLVHGTNHGYDSHGCRCEECVEAHKKYSKEHHYYDSAKHTAAQQRYRKKKKRLNS